MIINYLLIIIIKLEKKRKSAKAKERKNEKVPEPPRVSFPMEPAFQKQNSYNRNFDELFVLLEAAKIRKKKEDT